VFRSRRRPALLSVLGVVFVGLLVAWLIVNAIKTPTDFFNVLLIGVTQGSVYALVALGYTLVYGILQLINFAHGDVFALSGLFASTLVGGAVFGLTGTGSTLGLVGGLFATFVIAAAFGQAGARDPGHLRTWVVLVDGDRHQIELIEAEAARRKAEVHLVLDLVHVLERLWAAAWCFHARDDPAAEDWVAVQALAVLAGATVSTVECCSSAPMTMSAGTRPWVRRPVWARSKL
jgi:hypothetical protein